MRTRKPTRRQKAESKLATTTRTANKIIKAQAHITLMLILALAASVGINVAQIIWGW